MSRARILTRNSMGSQAGFSNFPPILYLPRHRRRSGDIGQGENLNSRTLAGNFGYSASATPIEFWNIGLLITTLSAAGADMATRLAGNAGLVLMVSQRHWSREGAESVERAIF